MKHFSTLCLLALLFLTIRRPAAAQAPAWQSARVVAVATAAATSNSSTVTATAVDAAGNVYIAGDFMNTVVLGSTTLTSLGEYDVFVAKFNPASNQFVWVQRAGGTRGDAVNALAVSGTNVYIAGAFDSPTVTFGTTTLTNAFSSDVFVAKLTDTGSTSNFVWAQRAGGISDEQAFALAVSGNNVYVAGYFQSPSIVFGATTLSNAGYYDVFVAKLTDTGSMGNFVWAQRAGGQRNDQVTALAVSGTSVYVTGDFTSPTASFGTTTLTNAGTSVVAADVFVAKLTDAGSTASFVWAQRAGGTGYEGAGALAVSGTSVYVAGNFESAVLSFGPVTLTNAGGADVFVVKLTDAGSTGSFVWAQRAGGAGFDAGAALAVSGTSVYMAGMFASTPASFGATALTNVGENDVFVAKLTDAGSTGSFAWAQQAGGSSIELATTLAVSGSSVYVAGHFISPTVSFGAITLTNPNPNNDTLGYLAALTDPTLTPTTAGHALAPAQLYPNPAQRTATLRLPAGTAPAPLILTDALGRTVRHYPAPAGSEAALDLQGVPAGLYLLRGAGPTQRLVVE